MSKQPIQSSHTYAAKNNPAFSCFCKPKRNVLSLSPSSSILPCLHIFKWRDVGEKKRAFSSPLKKLPHKTISMNVVRPRSLCKYPTRVLTNAKQWFFKVRPTPHTNPKMLLERSNSKLSGKSSGSTEPEDVMRSSPSDEPPPTKKHSEYAQLSDFADTHAKEHDTSAGNKVFGFV